MTRRVRPDAGGQQREEDELLPAAEYMLALVWFSRRRSTNGNPYLRCRFVVTSGPLKGRGFFSAWGLDTTQAGCLQRWTVWMELVDCNVEVDIDDDQQINRHFLGRAFKATVRQQTRNGYHQNDIDRLVYRRHYTAQDEADARTWWAEWQQSKWEHRDPSDPGPSDSDRPPPPKHEDPQWSEGSSFRDDDDIPF